MSARPPASHPPLLDLEPVPRSQWRVWLLPTVLSVVLLLTSLHSFLVFHVIAEMFASVVGIVLFVVAAATWRLTRNGLFLWLGCGYFWVSLVDLAHLLAYKGMQVVPFGGADLATQFWLVARVLQAVTLLAAPLFLSRRIPLLGAFSGLGILAVLGYIAAMAGLLPTAFVEGSGLTAFKIVTEYVIVALLVAAGTMLWRAREDVDSGVMRLLLGAVGLTVASELAFTLYVDVYGIANVVGHVLKFVAFWLVFEAVVRTTLEQPFRVLARDAGTYDAIPDPTLLVGRDGRVLQVNQAARTAFKGGRRTLVGADLHALIHPWRGDRSACGTCSQIVAGRPPGEEEVFDPSTGRHHQVTYTPLAGGALVVVMRDVTARRRAEDWMRTHADRLAMAMENGEQGLWDWNVATGTVYFSPVMESMLGYDPGTWEPHVNSWERLVHPDDVDLVMTTLQAHLDGHTPIYETEHRMRRADGSWAWILDKGKVVERAADGRPLRAVGTHTDITLLKHQEEALREKSAQLEESNRDLEQFAYIASHDLQEPLRMVSGYLTLLRRRHAGGLAPEAREFIEYAVDGTERMNHLIRDLLTYSRIATRAAPPEPVDTAQAVKAALATLHLTVADTGAAVDVANDLPVVSGDPSQVERLFQNLLGNALKYHAPDRPPRIRVWAEPAQPNATGEPMVRLLVRDNGIGIDPAQFDRIFMVFGRLHGRGEYDGTGIGLAVCKRIVERHRGTIDVTSRPGEGTTFSFTLPLVAGQDRAAASDERMMAPAG